MTTAEAMKLAPTMVLKEKPYEYPRAKNLVSTYHKIDLTEIEKLLVKDFKYLVRDNELIIQFYNDSIPTHTIKMPIHKNVNPLWIVQQLVKSGCTLMD